MKLTLALLIGCAIMFLVEGLKAFLTENEQWREE